MILSIGMIVKDEAKHLRKALDALTPIREAFACELIIADTGSTDGTYDIVKEYADVPMQIEWKNDFAWARTQTLKKSTGEWYLQLDADEVLKDVEDLIEFFKSGEYKNYNRGAINIRNTFNGDDNDYSMNKILRLIKLDPGTKYIGKIHEYLDNNRVRVVRDLKTYINHSGYDWSVHPEIKDKKFERNINLLKEAYRANPTQVMYILYLIRENSSRGTFEEVEEYINLASTFFMKKGAKEDVMYAALQYYRVNYHMLKKDWENVITVIDTYFEEVKTPWANRMDMYRIQASAYKNMGEYVKAAKSLEKAIEGYVSYKTNPMRTEVLDYINFYEINDTEMNKVADEMCKYLGQAGEFDMLRGKVTPDTMYGDYAREVISKNNFMDIIKIYEDIKDKPEDSKEYIAGLRAIGYIKNTEWLRQINEKIVEIYGTDRIYTKFLDLMLKFNNNEDVEEALVEFINDQKTCPAYFAQLILGAMSYQMDITQVLQKFEQKETGAIVDYLFELQQTKDILLDYVYQNNFLEGSTDLMQLNIISNLSNKLLLLQDTFYDELSTYELFNTYVLTRNEYLKQVYREDMYTVENAYLLQGEDTFVKLAEDAYNYTGAEYVSRLIKASEKFEIMKFVVKRVLDKYKKDLDEQDKIKEQETNELSEQLEMIKRSIISLIETDEEKAIELLKSYEAIHPTDEDLEYLKERLGLE